MFFELMLLKIGTLKAAVMFYSIYLSTFQFKSLFQGKHNMHKVNKTVCSLHTYISCCV